MADLITLEDYKEYKGINGVENDARFNVLIASVSQLVKTYCANSFIDYYSSPKTELFNIEGPINLVQLTESPVNAISSVEERTLYYGSYTALTSSDYYLDADTDTVYRVSEASYKNWPIGPGSVKIVYTAGYETIPEDLKLAVFDIITYYDKEEYKERMTIGGTSINNQFSSTQWRNVGFPDHIKRILDLYKLV